MKELFAPKGIALILIMIANGASAHSFNLGFVAPLSGPEAHYGKRALDALLLATKERDAHAGEESDGHLGGLDSYVFRIDSGKGADAVQRQVRELLITEGLEFVTGVFTPKIAGAVHDALSGAQTIFVDPVECMIYRASAGNPDRLSTMAEEQFPEVFKSIYGYSPGAHAAQGYMAGRLIDATVRNAGGRVSEAAALRPTYETVCASSLFE